MLLVGYQAMAVGTQISTGTSMSPTRITSWHSVEGLVWVGGSVGAVTAVESPLLTDERVRAFKADGEVGAVESLQAVRMSTAPAKNTFFHFINVSRPREKGLLSYRQARPHA